MALIPEQDESTKASISGASKQSCGFFDQIPNIPSVLFTDAPLRSKHRGSYELYGKESACDKCSDTSKF